MIPLSVLEQLQAHYLIPYPDPFLDALARYAELVREWNPIVSVVSIGDLDHLTDRHFVDSLSLAGMVRGVAGEKAHLLDIGSGGGFPAIPLKLALPDLRVTLVERSQKKLGFLRKVTAALGLEKVSFVLGEFPRAYQAYTEAAPDVFTARAVEKPARLCVGFRPLLEAGGVFLCQSEAQAREFNGTYHVAQVDDWWSSQGYRRGAVYVIRK